LKHQIQAIKDPLAIFQTVSEGEFSEVRTEHWPVASCLWEKATTQGGIGLCVRSS
jgi:hypothetical protein